jgi:hypothetical protein
VNCWVAPDATVAVSGVTATAMLPLFETVTWNACEAEFDVESVAATVKLKDPVLLGIPEMVPVVAPRISPVGSCPVATVN